MLIRLAPTTAKRRRLGQPVHCPILVSSPSAPSALLLHRLRIAAYERNGIKPFTNARAIQLLRQRAAANVAGFVEAIETDQRFRKVSRPDSRVWIQSQRFIRSGYGFLELSRDRIEISEVAGSASFTRITAHVRLLSFDRLLQFTRDDLIVEVGDARAFVFADAVTQRECLRQTLRGQSGLTGVAVLQPKPQPGYCEVRILFRGAFVELNRLEELAPVLFASSQRVVL